MKRGSWIKAVVLANLILSVLGSALVIGQVPTDCTRSAASLKVRGFYIGMTETEARRVYPKLQIQSADDMPEKTMANYEPPGMEEIFGEINGKGLAALYATFIDHRLARIEFGYPSIWSSLAEFTDAIAKPLSLPPSNQWKATMPTRNEYMQLRCEDVWLQTYYEYKAGRYESTRPNLTMAIPDFNEAIKRRQKEAADRKQKEFKP